MQKKVKIKFNSIQNDREITCMQKRMNFKSNSMQEAMVVTWMQMEGQGVEAELHTALSLFLALITWLASMKFILQSIFMSSDVSTGPIFSLDFWTNLLESKAYTSFHFHWQLQTEANFWNTGWRLKFHFHFSEIIQMSSVDTEPSQQSELFSILLWRGSWFWLFTHFGAIKSFLLPQNVWKVKINYLFIL